MVEIGGKPILWHTIKFTDNKDLTISSFVVAIKAM